jgi:hypothetical protein
MESTLSNEVQTILYLPQCAHLIHEVLMGCIREPVLLCSCLSADAVCLQLGVPLEVGLPFEGTGQSARRLLRCLVLAGPSAERSRELL